jgi:hypothetical protein
VIRPLGAISMEGAIMRLLKLCTLLALLTVAASAAAEANPGKWDPAGAGFNLQIHLRPADGGPDKGFGVVKFRQPQDEDKIVYLDVRLRHLAPDHGYYLQRATDTTVDGECTGTNWLTLGQGPDPQVIATDDRGKGNAELFRDLAAVPTGMEFDIHFRVIDAIDGAVVLESACHQFAVRQ